MSSAETLRPLTGQQVPSNLDELWHDFDPRREPLQTEVLQQWEQDGVICQLIRYQVGVFKGEPVKVAAFYAYRRDGKNLPAILSLHGGGQSAGFDQVLQDAKLGYASMSLNWGGNPLNFGSAKVSYSGPQTDWGKLDATHPPQRNQHNHFVSDLMPDDFTLDPVQSPRNSNWFLVLISARRAITWLESRPEVDGTKIGVTGHSMGGKLTTNLAAIDKRVRVAVPSCGGSGDLTDDQTSVPGGLKAKHSAMKLACVSDNAYIPRLTCPVLWLSPTNDFHAHIDNMAWNWRDVPDERLRFSISPHFNHRHTPQHEITRLLWFEQHLKGTFQFPLTPQIELNLNTDNGVPQVIVTPDSSQPIQSVTIYYSQDPHALTRFWRDGEATQTGSSWQAQCELLSLTQPLFVYADIAYEMPTAVFKDRSPPRLPTTFNLSSRVLSLSAEQLKAAGMLASDQPSRTIDDGSRGWRDWYQINWDHPPLWSVTTRKLKDPKWRGPDNAKLVFDVCSHTDNSLVVTVRCNQWGAFQPGRPAIDFSVIKFLKGSKDWQTIVVSLSEFAPTEPRLDQSLTDWQSVCELTISPNGQMMQQGQLIKPEPRAWVGPREIRQLRWDGGEYAAPGGSAAELNPNEHAKAFDDAIKQSLKQEASEQTGKRDSP